MDSVIIFTPFLNGLTGFRTLRDVPRLSRTRILRFPFRLNCNLTNFSKLLRNNPLLEILRRKSRTLSRFQRIRINLNQRLSVNVKVNHRFVFHLIVSKGFHSRNRVTIVFVRVGFGVQIIRFGDFR